MDNIFIKRASTDVLNELNSIEFDSSYVNYAQHKYLGETYKIFNLKPHEANILKQLCLSLGFDCAVSRNTIMCNCEYTNALVFCSNAQLKKLINKLKIQPFRLNILAKEFENINNSLEVLNIRNSNFDWTRPYVMGIVNVTPDSFSDGGKYIDVDCAVNHVKSLINYGADIIDIGGESTRPNATQTSIDEEIKRVIPVIEKIRRENIDIPISVDTRNYETAKLAIQTGADIINDVSGLDYDMNLYEYVQSNNIPAIITSNFASVEDIYSSLYSKIQKLLDNGVYKKNIIVDVGFGFGKTKDNNFELLKRFDEFKYLGVPLLIGISRKSFMQNAFNITVEEADVPTALYSAMLKNANIHRVHNVQLTKQFLDYAKEII